MSMGPPLNTSPAAEPAELDDDWEEISVDVSEDGHVWVQGREWQMELDPAEARQLAEALIEAAADAETPFEPGSRPAMAKQG